MSLKRNLCTHVEPPVDKAGRCRLCTRAANRRYYLKNPEAAMLRSKKWIMSNKDRRRNTQRDAQRRWKYGITQDDIRALRSRSGGKCEACLVGFTRTGDLSGQRECIDHDHDTGRVRGLLCNRCNTIEGILRVDSLRITQVRAYLDRERRPA